MNDLSFRGKWQGKKGKVIHINSPEPETFWKAGQTFQNEIREKKSPSRKTNRTVVAYQKRDSTHCKELDTFARKILLKCHKDEVRVFPEYLHGVGNVLPDVLIRGKNAQE